VKAAALAAPALLLVAATAHAGGLARPNGISARGVALGGAFTAIADDPTALHFNPAGAAWAEEGLMLGTELVYAPRTYTPIDASGMRGADQEASPLVPVPALGILIRLEDEDDIPSRLTLGAGLWNTFGGSLHYDALGTGVPAVNATDELVIEAVAGAAYEVSDALAIGAALRIGFGIFAVDAIARPADLDVSGFGISVGGTLGVLFRPIDAVQIGAAWRSPLTITTAGDGIINTGNDIAVDMEHEQPWPQQASLGVAVQVAAPVRVSAQLDWTDWSRWDRLRIDFPGRENLNQSLPLDWSDSVALRLGGEYTASPSLVVRAGGYYDSNAVPDTTIERIYLDGDKLGVSAGASVALGAAWRIDAAADVTLPNSRVVPDNTAEVPPGWTERLNAFPGEHSGSVFTLELALARRL
jgi:long-chain fatty acid transport protein